MSLPGGMPPLADLVKTWPAKRAIGDEGLERVLGLTLRLQVQRQGTAVAATAEIDLGDEGRFWPSDEALARCKALAQGGRAEIVYEAG
jgi:DNA polymerase-3 subunit alpha